MLQNHNCKYILAKKHPLDGLCSDATYFWNEALHLLMEMESHGGSSGGLWAESTLESCGCLSLGNPNLLVSQSVSKCSNKILWCATYVFPVTI